MSLLIKALEKAEQGKAAEGTAELSLQSYPQAGNAGNAGNSQSDEATQKQANQQVAAKVFSAKANKNNHQKKDKLLWIALAALLLLVIIGIQFYLYLNTLKRPDVILVRPPVEASLVQDAGQTPSATAEPVAPAASPTTGQQPASSITDTAVASTEPAPTASAPATSVQVATTPSSSHPVTTANTRTTDAANKGTSVFSSKENDAGRAYELAPRVPASAAPRRPSGKSQQYAFGDNLDTSNVPVKITRNQPENAVNPGLLAAYQAFSSGDDTTAQRNYRQVLRGDVRNVDALLGMAAIAARQGRNNDAMGWYGKVLEVEPRNSVAQAAMVNVLAQADPVSSESRIKSLIAQQPEAAHLHASLGNLYAEQSQWPSAQQAYFQAHHYAPNNAEYAFNLAVSLEQLGKPALALPYYQRALDLINSRDPASTGAVASGANVDRAQLESRIRQLQQ